MTRTRSALAVLGATAVLFLAACGDDDKPAAPKSTTVPPTAVSPAGSSSTATPAAGGKTLQLAEVGTVGKVLVSSDGRTLYLFEKDNGNTSACSGPCLENWPPYTASEPLTAADGLDAAKLKIVQGAAANQVSYDGHLLYFFKTDAKPGDANGIGKPSWYPVKADGTAAGK